MPCRSRVILPRMRPSAWSGAPTGRIPTTAPCLMTASLVDLIPEIAPDERTRRLMLVDNPAKLFGF